MNKGRIEQIDRPDVVFHAPANEFVYTFIGESCCLPVTFKDGKAQDLAGAPLALHLQERPADGIWRLYIRPSRWHLAEAAAEMQNRLTARVQLVEFLGDVHRYHLQAGALEFFADDPHVRRFQIGDRIDVGWRSTDMRAYQ
jgi:ABC-type Fe3+/spermidine/putrescine transport system ATPase subunit